MIERWQSLSVRARRWWSAAAITVGLFVVIGGLNSLGGNPSGPSLSSYATTDKGLAALDSLLESEGHSVTQLRETLDEAELDDRATIVALGQVFSGDEATAIRRFVERGGRLVVGGPEAEEFLQTIASDLQWQGDGAERARASITTVSGVSIVRAEGFGAWRAAPGNVVLRSEERDLAFDVALGSGRVVALADPSPLTNGFLGEADNAGFAVGLFGSPGRPVVFAENGHGFGTSSGLGALPARWKTALWFGAIAALVGALAAGKRFGPVDAEPDTPAPERTLYVNAVASTLARTRDADAAVEPLRRRAAASLSRRAGGRLDDNPDALVLAAQRRGLTEAEARRIVDPVNTDDDLVALGRVVSRLEES